MTVTHTLGGHGPRPVTKQWHKRSETAETYGLCVVRGPLGENPEMVAIRNPAAKLNHAKREVVSTRYFEVPAAAVSMVAPD